MKIRRRRVIRDTIPALAGPQPGSVRIQTTSASWLLSTASNSLLVNQSSCSVCFTFCLNSGGANGGNILTRSVQGFEVWIKQSTAGSFVWVFNQTGVNNQLNFTPAAGQVYFVVMSWSPTSSIWYMQGLPVSGRTASGNTESTSEAWMLGWSSASAVDISINQVGIWNGYALTQSDALYIRNGGSPQIISPSNLAAYWSCNGTFGTNPNPATDAGIRDATGNGHNFTLAGSSSLATYGGPLVYSPPTLVTPYISKSGQTAYFFPMTAGGAIQGINSIAASPTISVEFGGIGSPQTVQAQGPYWLPVTTGTSNSTYITYQLSCGPVQSAVVQAGGTGCVAPTATATGGGGTGCTLSVTEVGGIVTAVTVLTAGSGYTSPPTITISDSGGTGASAVPVMAGVQPSDVVTYSAPDSWIIGPAGPAPAAPSSYTSTAVANYSGQLEPALGGYLPFNLPANQRTMPVGVEMGGPDNLYYGSNPGPVNWIHRLGGWTGSNLTFVPNSGARLVSFSGTATSNYISQTSSNFIDARGYPMETGTWTLVVDDATSNGIGTGTALQFGLSLSSNYAVSPTGLNPATIAGTLAGGKLVGQTWQWTVTRNGTTSWNANLELQVGIPGQSGVYDYTASNEALFTPLTTAASGGVPNRNNLLGPSQETLNMVSTPTGRNPNRVRHSETVLSDSATLAVVDADDLNRVTDLSWDYNGATATVSITTMRTWALGGESWPAIFGTVSWSSPDVYLRAWNNPTGYAINSIQVVNGGSNYSSSPVVAVTGGGGSGFTVGTVTVSGGVITAIAVSSGGSSYNTPPTLTITDSTGSGATTYPVAAVAPPNQAMGWAGLLKWYCGECVCSAPHGLKTGQYLNLSNFSGSITVSNGTSATATGMNPAGLEWVVVMVTGPTTFAGFFASGLITNVGSGNPGGANNVIGSHSISMTGVIYLPPIGTSPYEGAATQAGSVPGANYHLCLPWAATDACVAVIAQRVRDNFPKGRKVYVEYTLEAWNFVPQEIFCLQMSFLGAFGSAAGAYEDAYAVRASQHHQTFISVFNQTDIHGHANRGGEIVRCMGSEWSGSNHTSNIVSAINNYNATALGLGVPQIQMDALLIAPYLDMPTGVFPNPTVAAVVTPDGGGTTGGSLAAGNYYLTYTWIDNSSGQETAAGPQTAVFAVASGDIPSVTLPALPGWAASANIYLTAAGGASGSEVLYQTGVTGTTTTLVLANTGSGGPPSITQLPSMAQAVASLATWKSTSISYQWPTPWTRKSVLDWFRHWLKYSTSNAGPGSQYAGHFTALAGYTLVNGQQAPFVAGYEGAIETIAPSNVDTGADGSGYYLRAQLQHDLYYDPDIYYCDMALLQQAQQAGMSEFIEFELCAILGGVAGNFTYLWPLAAWAGQPAGYGDGTGTTTVGCVGTIDGVNPAGTLVTNKFWMDDGKSHHLDNVAVRLQAVRDWMDDANPITNTPLNWKPAQQQVGERDRRLRRGRAGQAYRSFSGKPIPTFTPLNWRPARIRPGSFDQRVRAGRAGQAYRSFSGAPIPNFAPFSWKAARVRPGSLDQRRRPGRAGMSTQGRINDSAGIVSISPTNGAFGVLPTVTISAVFAQAMNAGTISTSTVILTGPGGTIVGTVTYTSGTKTATFAPTSNLSSGLYTFTLTSSITSAGGTPIVETTSRFRVGVHRTKKWFSGLSRKVVR